MILPLGKFVTFLLLVFSGTLAVIHAQPYVDADLRLFLDPECSAPCFIGIQPGLSDLTTAQAILRSHPWVSTLRYARGMAADSGFLSWMWSGAQPSFINGSVEGKLWIQGGRVQWLEVATRFTFGDLWLLQMPESGRVAPASVEPRRVSHQAHYDRVIARTEVFCPLLPHTFWSAPVVFRILQDDPHSPLPSYKLPRWRGCA